MSTTAQRIAHEQAGQPILHITDASFTLDGAAYELKIPVHCTLVTGALVEDGTYNINMPTPAEVAGQVCVVMVYSETEEGGVVINLRSNGTNIISTVNSPDSINVVMVCDGQYWHPVYNVAAETNVSMRLLPSGGTTGQILAKASDDPYDVEWVDAT